MELAKPVELAFDKQIYGKSALVRTGYQLADLLDIALSDGGAVWLVTARPIADVPEDPAVLFRRTALDFELREKLEAQTRATRDRLIATALAEALPR